MAENEPYDSSMDAELLNDFVTEASELLEQVDQDLVALEGEPNNTELLDNVFRAMHTIKGSGSFLGLGKLCDFTHAAEDALNVLRKGQAELDALTMDTLLMAVDVIKRQTGAIREGEEPEDGPKELVASLQAVGGAPADAADNSTDDSSSPAGGGLELSASKLDLLPFMVQDLITGLDDLRQHADAMELDAGEASELHTIAEELTRSVEFFEVGSLCVEMSHLRDSAELLRDQPPSDLVQILPRIGALIDVMAARASALEEQRLIDRTTTVLCERLLRVCAGEELAKEEQLDPDLSGQAVLAFDDGELVSDGAEESTTSETDTTNDSRASLGSDETSSQAESETKKPAKTSKIVPQGEQTIRVDVSRLEGLLNLMGELVLQKNRVLGIAKRLSAGEPVEGEMQEEFEQVASDLDRVTAELQMGVMKTRMQPMHKLFSRYPRVIRDLARMTGKQIDLNIVGAETEVDKSVIEALGDPLVHILRNSCDHGVETPDVREAAGKPAMGTISLTAQHDGNHVVVVIRDDGKGIDPEVIGRKAVENDLVTQSELDDLSEGQILQMIFAPGFSTAEQVSDLSGRGVGMDVVRTNITRLNGTVEVTSVKGEGSCVTIRIPLTLAIMPAMMVKIGTELYALPLSNIHEIVSPEPDELYTVRGQLVMRLRDEVLPLIDLRTHLSGTRSEGSESKPKTTKEGVIGTFAVIAASGERRAGLLVDGLIGQQEVVIKPLDDLFDRNMSVSGATVREDGGVSLIVDVGKILSVVREVA